MRARTWAMWMVFAAAGGCSGGKPAGSDHGAGAVLGGAEGGAGRDGSLVDGASSDADARDAAWLGATDGSLPFDMNEAGQILCGAVPCACSDGLDNDEDGLTDLDDPECVSGWDDDEGSFATGIPGDNRDDACQDCFFDGNSGSGNDGCRLPTSCFTDGTAASGQGSCSSCEQTDRCRDYCEAYTPNGCDCFGCCDVRVGAILKHVLIGSGCNIDGDSLAGCTECVPSTSCVNECGRCELCVGKTLDDLPEECFVRSTPDGGAGDTDAGVAPDGGEVPVDPPYTCDNGEQVCGAAMAPCADGYSCEFGCCVRVPVVL